MVEGPGISRNAHRPVHIPMPGRSRVSEVPVLPARTYVHAEAVPRASRGVCVEAVVLRILL